MGSLGPSWKGGPHEPRKPGPQRQGPWAMWSAAVSKAWREATESGSQSFISLARGPQNTFFEREEEKIKREGKQVKMGHPLTI